MRAKRPFVLLASLLVFVANVASADVIKVAVAANFRAVAEQLAEGFEHQSNHRVILSSGPTGGLYNQIIYGAPFDIFLSADSRRPQQLQEQGHTVDQPRTYALGQLVLWVPGQSRPELSSLEQAGGKIAMANPETAPYGLAAQQVLKNTGLWHSKKGQLVQGGSVQQSWQFVKTGNASMGFVALSQLKNDGVTTGYWLIPEHLYAPIRQDMVVLNGGQSTAAAQQFANYILQPQQQALVHNNGYHGVINQ